MKITDIKVHLLSFPLTNKWITSGGAMGKRDTIIIQLFTDEGIIGYGEAHHAKAHLVVAQIIENVLKPIVLGADPFYHPLIFQAMYERVFLMGQAGISISAISGIEMALWDIVGKSLGVSVSQLLGRCQDKIRVYAGGASLGWQSPGELVQEALSLVDRGFTALKLRIGRGVKLDLQAVEAVAIAVGEEVDLIVDANCGYERQKAMQLARELGNYNILWLEEPLPYNDLHGYKLLAQKTITPLAAGENFFTLYGFQTALSIGSFNILQPDCCKTGGISESYKIASLASSLHLNCALHIFGGAIGLAASLQVLGSIRNGIICEYDGLQHQPLRDDLVSQPFELENGYLKIPNSPGLGVEPILKNFKKYPYFD